MPITAVISASIERVCRKTLQIGKFGFVAWASRRVPSCSGGIALFCNPRAEGPFDLVNFP